MNILVLNAGSSSVKFHLYRLDRLIPLTEPEKVLASGEIERIGTPGARLQINVGQGEAQSRQLKAASVAMRRSKFCVCFSRRKRTAGSHLRSMRWGIASCMAGRISCSRPRRRGSAERNSRSDRTAPLHTPGGMAGIEAGLRLLPDAPAVAVFDTAFHHDLPPVAAHYALPRDLAQQHASAPLRVSRHFVPLCDRRASAGAGAGSGRARA